jgi:hypothetical protein
VRNQSERKQVPKSTISTKTGSRGWQPTVP